MADPLSEVVRLLRPQAMLANVISGRGNWAVRYSELGLPSFCIVLEGGSVLTVDGHEPITISAGDFVLLPTTPGFTISSFAPAPPVYLDPRSVKGRTTELRYGDPSGPADMRSLGGAFQFDGANPGMLVALLPRVIHVKASNRLTQLVQMVGDESSEGLPGGDYMLSRLAEMLLIEAMRASATTNAPPGLLRGLGDERLARALKALHARVERPWTVAELADAAALSRSTFFERFTQVMGVPPMEYLLRWRLELAKELLRSGEQSIAAIAERIGYGSASAFSVAFSRQVGQTPSRYARG
ncbi:helix-turn-helix protein [Panacagrimonas perspica]|uniref:Helix-turn-helix protein n=1 Tax=Panacagrimonas perspica TaxID=381431 RepID=A0A4S3K9E8_9GAMM|nr:AraC family transcriptional regulator [Panacagrimonas perspica]TDU28598.1 helix-turn-helix protein [Panacagrimonas perspica]THD04933.1 AraC family transcriptional regulator [Panacagrimonas perspica]